MCLSVCDPKPENRAGSVVSAGVNTAQTITVDVCVWEHCTPHRASRWESAAANGSLKAAGPTGNLQL